MFANSTLTGGTSSGSLTSTDNCINYWPTQYPNYVAPVTYYYPWYVPCPDAAVAGRVTALERENAELRGKVDTLEKMLAALIGGKTNA